VLVSDQAEYSMRLGEVRATIETKLLFNLFLRLFLLPFGFFKLLLGFLSCFGFRLSGLFSFVVIQISCSTLGFVVLSPAVDMTLVRDTDRMVFTTL
jgi:hypothetical protein